MHINICSVSKVIKKHKTRVPNRNLMILAGSILACTVSPSIGVVFQSTVILNCVLLWKFSLGNNGIRNKIVLQNWQNMLNTEQKEHGGLDKMLHVLDQFFVVYAIQLIVDTKILSFLLSTMDKGTRVYM